MFPPAKQNQKVLPTKIADFHDLFDTVKCEGSDEEKVKVRSELSVNISFSGYFLASVSRVMQSKSNPSLSLGSALSRT